MMTTRLTANFVLFFLGSILGCIDVAKVPGSAMPVASECCVQHGCNDYEMRKNV